LPGQKNAENKKGNREEKVDVSEGKGRKFTGKNSPPMLIGKLSTTQGIMNRRGVGRSNNRGKQTETGNTKKKKKARQKKERKFFAFTETCKSRYYRKGKLTRRERKIQGRKAARGLCERGGGDSKSGTGEIRKTSSRSQKEKTKDRGGGKDPAN